MKRGDELSMTGVLRFAAIAGEVTAVGCSEHAERARAAVAATTVETVLRCIASSMEFRRWSGRRAAH
ncbi:MAG TPA: hypothetical protein VIC55_02255, partial [Gemmatimonadaceae bacterium]